jgi:putative effector of murein hydrolase LrgA (UPF0299 family)
MLKRVLQILLVVAIVVLCYYVIIWVLALLGIMIPQQILVVIMVILGLTGAIAVMSGRADNINWWN